MTRDSTCVRTMTNFLSGHELTSRPESGDRSGRQSRGSSKPLPTRTLRMECPDVSTAPSPSPYPAYVVQRVEIDILKPAVLPAVLESSVQI